MKPRILQIVSDPQGGIRKHIHDILHNLGEDFDFYYISSSRGDARYEREKTELENTVHILNLDIKKPPHPSDIANMARIIRFMAKHHIDIVHGHGAKGGLYARVCGKITGKKVVYTPHGGAVHSMFGKTEDIIYRITEAALAHVTDRIIFESVYTKNAYIKRFGAPRCPSSVNHNGIASHEPDRTEIKQPGKSPLKIGFFGILRNEKGPDILLTAGRELYELGMPIEVHFHGHGPLERTLKEQVEELGLGTKIRFHGEIDDTAHAMEEMDLIVIPSRFESFGYVALEAMALRISVIAADTGGLPEVLPSKEFLFEANDPKACAEKILAFTNQSQQVREENIVYGLKHVRARFSLEGMLEGVRNAYKDIS
ncbi:glycosyltransferase family 4 protein [Halothiobacillus sp.]|uniref:glycosyltransferase family 4 protein n=1 Tax=Halothiobacillus sp. TaxID=1891311 RepID=UPI002AD36CB5|nr:glycosyltransferase family 4 protein [Halothiobacillus sp.]